MAVVFGCIKISKITNVKGMTMSTL